MDHVFSYFFSDIYKMIDPNAEFYYNIALSIALGIFVILFLNYIIGGPSDIVAIEKEN